MQVVKLIGIENQNRIRLSTNRLLFISILSAILFWVIFTIGHYGNQSDSTFVNSLVIISRISFAIIGPFLSTIFFLGIVFSIFTDELKQLNFKLIIKYTVVSGLVSIIFAISLNSRAFIAFLLSSQFLEIDIDSISLVIFGIIGPIIEETAKILPVFYLSRGVIANRGKKIESRLLSNGKLPILLGLVTGLIFNLLETYWYTFNVSYIFILDDVEIWNNLASQVILRGTNVLHLLTTAIAAYGISTSLWNTTSKSMKFKDFKVGGLFFISAVFLHGLWNGSLIMADENTAAVRLISIDIPIFNLVMMVFMLFGLIFLLQQSNKLTDEKCVECDEWHSPDIKDHKKIFYPKISFWNRIKENMGPKYNNYHCKSCKSIIDPGGKICNSCNARNMYSCPNCSAPLPVYESECWRCNKAINPVFDNIMQFRTNNGELIIEGIMYILTATYIGVILTVLIVLIYSPNTLENDFTGVQIIFLGMIGSSFIIILKWLRIPSKKALGMSVARTIVGMMIIEFSLILLVLGSLFIYISFVVSGLLYLIEWILLTFWGVKIIFSFQPLFHQEDI